MFDLLFCITHTETFAINSNDSLWWKTNECALREHYLITSTQGKRIVWEKREVNKLFSYNMLHDMLKPKKDKNRIFSFFWQSATHISCYIILLLNKGRILFFPVKEPSFNFIPQLSIKFWHNIIHVKILGITLILFVGKCFVWQKLQL